MVQFLLFHFIHCPSLTRAMRQTSLRDVCILLTEIMVQTGVAGKLSSFDELMNP